MPWCPKCKSEYREGFTVCADCGGALVDDEAYEKLEAEREAFKEAQYLRNVLGYGNPAGLKEGLPEDVAADPEAGVQAMEGAASGVGVQAAGSAASGVGVQAAEKERPDYSVYQDSTERASENRSSAWVLMAVGGAGIIFIALGITGVVPLEFGNSYLFYGVMAAVFILFLVAGIVSMKNARIFEKKAESENSLRDTMLAWCRDNLCAEDLDRQIGAGIGETDEILYFKRFECIKAKLNYQFVNLDQRFLEKFIDDCVYELVFEEDEDKTA